MRDNGHDDDDDDYYLEMAESNMDWSATAAIYVEESKVVPLPLLPQSNNNNNKTRGFCGNVQLTLHTASTSLAFCHKATKENHHRYFTLSKPPILNIELTYYYYYFHDDDDDDDDDSNNDADELIMPSQVQLAWEYYPTELPELEKPTVLSWLTQKCQAKLQEETKLMTMCASFSIVELCEHELWSYWETIHQSHNGFRLILLPPKMDLLYHSNIGLLLEPREEALQLERWKEGATKVIENSPPKDALEYAKQALIQSWKKLYVSECPICLDTTIRSDKGITLPMCGHFYCQVCFPRYLQTKVTELALYRQNPFLCPLSECRAEISIPHIVKSHLSKPEYKLVLRWQKDLIHPICHSLDRCLSKACTAKTAQKLLRQTLDPKDVCMRKRSKDTRNTFVFCEVCDKTWCELCLKRIKSGVTRDEHKQVCESLTSIKFCRRYLRATNEQKQNCQQKYPWIVNYAISRQHDGEALLWILEHGQICPNCSNGVERSEGCFHMQCTQCATHFCYECGQELFPPYYGTHHCWEEANERLFDDQFQ